MRYHAKLFGEKVGQNNTFSVDKWFVCLDQRPLVLDAAHLRSELRSMVVGEKAVGECGISKNGELWAQIFPWKHTAAF